MRPRTLLRAGVQSFLARQLKTVITFSSWGDALVICLCRAVNDRTIRGAIDGGARTVREVCHRTGAASSCGSCARDVAKLIGERAQLPGGRLSSGMQEG